MYSERFRRPILVTVHALGRMIERDMNEQLLLDLIDTGQTRYKDATRLWVYKSYPDRDDNLLCAAVALDGHSVGIKTVMHRFQLE